MISLPQIREKLNKIIVLGNHEPIIQSILDFDFISGKPEPSVLGIVTGRSGFAKYFWGRSEILLPTLATFSDFRIRISDSNLWLLNLASGRRTLSSTLAFMQSFPAASGGVLFAEGVPELHSLELINSKHNLMIGPASVGLVIPRILKLGPIGGITPDQLEESHLVEQGKIAVLSASGGMTNELINITVSAGHRLSFALSFGGDRFPVLSPREAFLLAENDIETNAVLYYGELGGEDEYELVRLKEEGKFTKQVIAHIAGTVASLFPQSPQFGHAKAKADNSRVTALAKRTALKEAGFRVSNSFSEFINLVARL